jgi:endoglucanase Acf2
VIGAAFVLPVAAVGLSACDAPAPVPSASAKALDVVVPQESIAPPVEIASELAAPAPTNRWYSGLVLGDIPQPVFASPLSFSPRAGGFAWGLPVVQASQNAIISPASDDVTVTIASASGRPLFTAGDSLHVQLQYRADLGTPLADVDLAQGWPAVGLRAATALTLTTSVTWEAVDESLATTVVDGTTYAVAVTSGSVAGPLIDLAQDGSALFFAVPLGADPRAVADALGGVVTGVDVTYSTTDRVTTTSIRYVREEGGPTLVAAGPERTAGLECLGSFMTVRGESTLCQAESLDWEVPAVPVTTALDLSSVSVEQADALVRSLNEDAARMTTLPADTYFGGKGLARLANLLQVADALEETTTAAELSRRLSAAITEWAEPNGCEQRRERCFVYDPHLRGMVGLAPSFGSDEFNDHHFHYGYLLYAAAIAVQHDPELLPAIEPVLTLVAHDFGSPTATATFPQWRNFDPYQGHSWASGYSPFADGNNQESVSEAVNAWAGTAAWADVSGDAALGDAARWMLALESEAATRLWLAPDLSDFPEFQHDLVALEWGGKRDYATWFSPDPAAMLGIELLPLAPAQLPTWSPADATGAARVLAQVATAAPDGTVDGAAQAELFADYLIMYRALASAEDNAAAWQQARDLPVERIDDGNSRTYMLAWIAASGARQ